ncbi:hypothetical protein ACP70R_012139 [Stipagrostis hirtigluma subsp. patula]
MRGSFHFLFHLRPSPAAGRRRRRQRRRSSPVSSLSDDLLLEIFLRLPCLATLVRAACACRAWRRAVASSPRFRRRFCALHPMPLLGAFVSAPRLYSPGPALSDFVPAPALRGQPQLAAAVRNGDFSLASLALLNLDGHAWSVLTCERGFLLLIRGYDSSLAVVNPLTRRCERLLLPRRFAKATLADSFWANIGDPLTLLYLRLLVSEDDPVSYRVLVLSHNARRARVRAAIFSSATGEWSSLPSRQLSVPERLGAQSMQAEGIQYWVTGNSKYLVSLDTTTMEFTVGELPHNGDQPDASFCVGETRDGKTCMVKIHRFDIGVFMPTSSRDGWFLDKIANIEPEFQSFLLDELDQDVEHFVCARVLLVWGGYAYLEIKRYSNPQGSPYELFSMGYNNNAPVFPAFCPYVMQWPPSVVGNYGQFALEDAP